MSAAPSSIAPPAALELEYAQRLLNRQTALQAEAAQVLLDLDLEQRLAPAGRVDQVGSSVMGLMVWRDIDFNILCEDLDPQRIFDIARPWAKHPRVKKLRFSNETGQFNSTGAAWDEGIYWGMRYYTTAGDEWKLDMWFLPAAVPRPEFTHIQQVADQLTDETRLAILWIKDHWYRQPTYRAGVVSIDIYNAVLDHGVRTPDQFTAYLRAHGKPVA